MTTRKKGMRTKKGTVTAKARKKVGMKDGEKKGKFPVFDEKSARSAIKLRHHGKGVSASTVLAKVARWARANNKPAILKAVEAARERDRKRGKGK
jgi:hypothetical protein